MQVAGGEHVFPDAFDERFKPGGDVLDPLHHLLAGDVDGVALAKVLLDPIIRQMIIETGENDMDGQS